MKDIKKWNVDQGYIVTENKSEIDVVSRDSFNEEPFEDLMRYSSQ